MTKMNENVTHKPHQRTKQITRTQEDFITALFQLLASKPIGKVSINELVERAGYSRRTFYRHFNLLEDIIKLKLTALVLGMFDSLRSMDKHTDFTDLVTVFFNYWQPHQRLLIILHQQGLLYLLRQVILHKITDSKLAEDLQGDPYSAYLQYFGLSGMFSLLEVWVAYGCKQAPQEMGQVAQKIKEYF